MVAKLTSLNSSEIYFYLKLIMFMIFTLLPASLLKAVINGYMLLVIFITCCNNRSYYDNFSFHFIPKTGVPADVFVCS